MIRQGQSQQFLLRCMNREGCCSVRFLHLLLARCRTFSEMKPTDDVHDNNEPPLPIHEESGFRGGAKAVDKGEERREINK